MFTVKIPTTKLLSQSGAGYGLGPLTDDQNKWTFDLGRIVFRRFVCPSNIARVKKKTKTKHSATSKYQSFTRLFDLCYFLKSNFTFCSIDKILIILLEKQ